MKKNNKGFTLAELLVVVAIIAVLVAISIPVFTAQLEKSKEAVDAANIRTEYAELMTEVLTGDITTHVVQLKQTKSGWQNTDIAASLGEIMTADGTPADSGKATLTYNNSTNVVTCKFE